MKKIATITCILAASSALNAQTVNTSRGILDTATATFGNAGSATYDFTVEGGSGTAAANGIFTAISGANRSLTYSEGTTQNEDGSGFLSIQFDTPGEYIIRLGDFDASTTSSAILDVAAGFTSSSTGVGVGGGALGGTFLATALSPTSFGLDVVDSGATGADGTNGFIALTYTVARNQTLNFTYTDNTGDNDALGWTVTQTSFTAIPEPSTALLGALAGLGFLARRKRA